MQCFSVVNLQIFQFPLNFSSLGEKIVGGKLLLYERNDEENSLQSAGELQWIRSKWRKSSSCLWIDWIFKKKNGKWWIFPIIVKSFMNSTPKWCLIALKDKLTPKKIAIANKYLTRQWGARFSLSKKKRKKEAKDLLNNKTKKKFNRKSRKWFIS